MLNMSDINDIRELGSCGYKISDIHRMTGYDQKTIRKYLRQEDFSPAPTNPVGRPSVLDPYKPVIDEWIQENDKRTWSKQHHTAKRIYDRLKAETDYSGSYDTVQKYMKTIRRDIQNKGSQELIWEPGFTQVDFGEADFIENGQQIRRKYLVVSFPYSNYGITQLFCGETAECVCQGLEDIFEFVGGVSKVLVFDNATGVGHRVHDEVMETEMFRRFRAHYRFHVRYCNPESGWEKGNVENKVGTVRRNLFVPMPQYTDMVLYNKQLLRAAEGKLQEKHYKKLRLISELFAEDKQHLLDLPSKAFNVCRYERYKADGYGRVCLDGRHFYSTRPENHNQYVMVGIRAHYIDILKEDGELLVRHRRQYGKTRTEINDYSTSLAVLSRNAGAWFNSGVRQDLPEMLRDYMDSLEKPDRKSRLRLLSELNDQYGYKPAIEAFRLAFEKNGAVRESDAKVIAERITGYGVDTPPEAGPSLSVYDDAFIKPRQEGGEAAS
jgi:transposase